MIKPSKEELLSIYAKFKNNNNERIAIYGRNTKPGAFAKIAKDCNLTSVQVKNILQGRVATWREHHFKAYKLAVKMAKNL